MIEQYPAFSIYLVMLIGGLLAIFRPYAAFLFAVLVVSSLDANVAALTRTFLGPYFNLVDSCLVVMFFALVIDLGKSNRSPVFPMPVVLIGIAWTIGTVVGVGELGPRYEVIRESRAALNFPLTILVAFNIVVDSERSRQLVYVLFLGGFLASVQHVIGLRSDSADMLMFRRMGLVFSPGIYFLVAASQYRLFADRGKRFRLLYLFGLILFAFSVVLSLTRSIWIGALIAPIAYALIVGQSWRLPRYLIAIAVIALAVAVIFPLVMPSLNLVDLVFSRAETLVDASVRYQTTRTRVAVIQVETSAWLQGNVLIGRGIGFSWAPEFIGRYGNEVAWGHIGYVSYLARMGIIGFLVYGIFVPFSGVRAARGLYLDATHISEKDLAALGLASLILLAITFAMSGSYLQAGMITPGLLMGAVMRMRSVHHQPSIPLTDSNTRSMTIPVGGRNLL